MVQIHLIRHGKRERRLVTDPSLTDDGRVEARLVADALVDMKIAAVFSSPLARAKETAEILAVRLKLDVVEDVRLRERMNWGDVIGQSFDDFVAMWDRCSHDRDYRPVGADSSRDAGKRIEAFVARCDAQEFDGDVVAVAHGGIIADFLLNVFSADALAQVRPEFCENPYSGDIMRECSITTVTYNEGDYRIEAIGQAAYWMG